MEQYGANLSPTTTDQSQFGKKLVQNWLDTLATYNADAIVAQYSDYGILLGTLAHNTLIGKTKIKSYFVDVFLPQHPNGVIVDCYTQNLGDNNIIVDGNYNFELDDPDTGGRQTVQARYTFEFSWDSNTKWWKIRTHHSSLRPPTYDTKKREYVEVTFGTNEISAGFIKAQSMGFKGTKQMIIDSVPQIQQALRPGGLTPETKHILSCGKCCPGSGCFGICGKGACIGGSCCPPLIIIKIPI